MDAGCSHTAPAPCLREVMRLLSRRAARRLVHRPRARARSFPPSICLSICLHPGTEDSTRGVLRYVDAQYPGAALDAIVYVTVAGSAVTADKERTLTLTLT